MNPKTFISMISEFSDRHQAPKPIWLIFGDTRTLQQILENREKFFIKQYPPNPWVPGCEGTCSILYPASSVVMRACYSLDFSYFRNLHPAFSYPFIPACFMMYFACWIAPGNCLEDDNGAQGQTQIAWNGHGSSAPEPPGKPSEIMMFQAYPQVTKRHQNRSQSHRKACKNDTKIDIIPPYVKSWFLQYLPHQSLILEPQTSIFRHQNL